MNIGAVRDIELDASMELEDVFLHFFAKFKDLQSPSSVAEARITSGEVELLQQWFDRQYEKPRNLARTLSGQPISEIPPNPP